MIAEQVSESGVVTTEKVQSIEYLTALIPVSLNLTLHFPLQPPFYWHAGGSLSYQFLLNTENNYEENIEERRFYSGFGWGLCAGVEYGIGSRSAVMAELFYNHGVLKGDEEMKAGLPSWKEVDVSGLGVRAGVRFHFF